MNIQRVNSTPAYNPNFNARLRIDTATADTRTKVFTLGMLMSNFWIDDARYTFSRIRGTNVFDIVEISTKDDKTHIIEKILKDNEIKYEKISSY